MHFGLSKTEFDYFKKELVEPLKRLNANIWIFGSRARNNHHKYSDVDVLLTPKTKDIESAASQICETFEEGNFPFKLDLVFDEDLASSYRPFVDQDKVSI